MNNQIKLDAFRNVANSGIATCDLSNMLGKVLEKITLTLGGTFTRAMMTRIELFLNNKSVWVDDGTRAEAKNVYNGGSTDVTILKIDFMDRKAVTINARQAGAWDLSRESGITSARLEVTIAGATNPTLVGFADVSPPVADASEKDIRWLLARRHRTTQVIGASGTEIALDVPHLAPNGGGSVYRRVYIYSANMTALKGMREGVTEFDLTKAQNEAAQKDNFKVPQANLVVLDPVQDGQLLGRVWDTRPGSGVRSAVLYGTFSAGETITIDTDELIPLAAY